MVSSFGRAFIKIAFFSTYVVISFVSFYVKIFLNNIIYCVVLSINFILIFICFICIIEYFPTVGRLVKYTGFGNAAGHLAQKGLLSGGRSGQYSSSSEGSDTEEYLEAQPNIDPVVGCTMPPRVDPFEGMSEEQVILLRLFLLPSFPIICHGFCIFAASQNFLAFTNKLVEQN